MDHHQPKQDDASALLLTQNFFLLHVHGTVESVAFPGEDFDHLRCKVVFRFGPDWALVGGGGGFADATKAAAAKLQAQTASATKQSSASKHAKASLTKQTGAAAAAAAIPSVFISQTAVKADDGQKQFLSRPQPTFVWNLPLEVTFQSTNVFGWPQLVVTVHSSADGSSETVRGYGWCHLPTRPGVHRLQLTLFRPQASTALGRLSSWLGAARAPEFVDARLAAGAEGRSLVAVANTGGHVTLSLSLLLKDFKKYGFVSR